MIAAKLERLGHTAPAEALREYLLERFTAGQLSIRIAVFRGRNLRELLDRRPWVAHTEAAKLLGMRHAAVADLVRRGVLEGQVRPAGNCRRLVGVVSRESLQRLMHDLKDSLDCRQAAKRLGIFHKTVWQLAQEACWNGPCGRPMAGASRAAVGRFLGVVPQPAGRLVSRKGVAVVSPGRPPPGFQRYDRAATAARYSPRRHSGPVGRSAQ